MPPAFLRLSQVISLTGLKRSTIYNLINAGNFPRPVNLTPRINVWPSDEIAAFMEARLAERDAV